MNSLWELIFLIFGILALDFIIGDPKSKFHPVALLGSFIIQSEKISRKISKNEYYCGVFCVLLVLFTILICNLFILKLINQHHKLQFVYTVIIGWNCIALRSLMEHGFAVAHGLKKSLNNGRRAVGMLVSRETQNMTKKEVVKAAVESVSENFIDSITSPLFWLITGYFFYGFSGATVGILTLRIINTFDAMVGYKNLKYKKLGFFAAKFDDLLHFIPARMTPIAVALGAIIINKGKLTTFYQTLKYAIRDGHKHASPNSCYGMAAFAGALGIRLGGPTKYKTGIKKYPYWGKEIKKLSLLSIKKSCQLVLFSTIFFIAIMLLILSLIS